MQTLHPSQTHVFVDIQVVVTALGRVVVEVSLMRGTSAEERILTKKTYNSSGSVIETIIYVDENFVRIVNASGSYDFTYVKHEGQLVAQLNPDGSKYFVHGDHLGSTSAVTNSTGSVVESTTYSPHGEILSGGVTSRFDYTGKEYDTVVGDYDYNFRKYNQAWGIFTQPDSLLPNVYDPQQLNRYSYARNNPYRYTDTSGHTAQAEGEVEMTFVHKLLWMRETRFRVAQENLQRELLQKYYTPSTESTISCVNCPVQSPPSFKELQEMELQAEFDIILNAEGKIIGYQYQGQFKEEGNINQIADRMRDFGFSNRVVKNEIKSAYKEKTGQTITERRLRESAARWWTIFKKITEKVSKAKQKSKGGGR